LVKNKEHSLGYTGSGVAFFSKMERSPLARRSRTQGVAQLKETIKGD
jgi:hypothetical protein